MVIEILLGIIIFVLITGFAFVGTKLESIHNALSLYMPRREEVNRDAKDIEDVLKDILEIKIAE